jgi:2-oxo-4-hydroxy-4-carboxy--5-ureidoimidazoline (OHCU) decarboxylase
MPEEVDFEEVLIAPMEAIVRKIAASVAEAQLRLDEAALETQEKLIEAYPELAKVGYIPTWYHMPEINVELKMVMHYEQRKEGKAKGKYQALWTPFNAKYRSNFTFDAEGTSNLKFKIVSTPPPIAITAAKPSE